MEIIHHRRNTIELLNSTPISMGVEIDIRTYNNKLVIHHDPFLEGVNFEEWIKEYNHGTLILNVKEEGLEEKILEILSKFKINNFFFLDQSFPFLIKTAKKGESRCAIRLSEYESIETVLNLKNLVKWVWVDFYSKFPLDKDSFRKLKINKFNICLVSPELQGYNKNHIVSLKNILKKEEIKVEAVCTKQPSQWIN
tara:strand:- start:22 stop:609 length:588 start_codon:yes stop_codon:yes gene_type:complete